MKSAYRATKRDPKVGETVLIMEPMQERATWKMAKITKLIPSDDGEIRSVELKTLNGNPIIRPITKIVPFEIDIENFGEQEQEQDENGSQEQNHNLGDVQVNENSDIDDPNEFDEIAEIECVEIQEDE